MRVAILGAKGQLGQDLLKIFPDAIGLGHSEADVTDLSSLSILKEIRPEAIINCAAYVRVDDAEEEAEEAFKVNAIGALNVARVANEIGAINVYISTDYVFDGNKESPYVEEDVPNPINVYGASKYAGEIFTRNYSEKWYIIRVSSLFGVAGSSGKGGNFVETMIGLAKEGKEIRVVDDMIMSPTHTLDVARGLKKLLEISPPSGIYHMANEGNCSWYEFAKKIFELANIQADLIPIKIIELKRKAKRPKNSSLEDRKIKELGIKMPRWEKALEEYLRLKGYLRR